jgi:hypothetical protein
MLRGQHDRSLRPYSRISRPTTTTTNNNNNNNNNNILSSIMPVMGIKGAEFFNPFVIPKLLVHTYYCLSSNLITNNLQVNAYFLLDGKF